MGGARAEETLRGVVLGVFNDFLDGDMEVVRTLLRECSPCYSEIMGAARRAVEVERKMRVLFASPMCLVLWPCARCPRLSAHMTRVIHASFEDALALCSRRVVCGSELCDVWALRESV